MSETTSAIERKSFRSPDETRPFKDKGKIELVNVGDGMVGRATFEPGWRWSEHVKPIAGTDSCQAAHLSYVVSGRMAIRSDDGTEVEVGPGEVVRISPGHDAWVVGGEPSIQIDFQGATNYAKPG